MKSDDFFNVKMTNFQSSKGTIPLPALYRDVSLCILYFWVDPGKFIPGDGSKELLPDNLTPCRFFNGKILVNVSFFNYRDSSLGPYNEVSLSTLIYPNKFDRPPIYLPQFLKKGANWKIGSFIHNLPVTTEESRIAGDEVWGLPKFVTEIPFDLKKNNFSGAVKDPQTKKDIVSLSGNFKKSFRWKAFDLVLFSNHRDTLLKTIVDIDSVYDCALKPDMTLKIGESDHDMAENLRALDLDGRKPFMAMWTHKFKSRLNDGVSHTG